jgi:L-lactate dehydrogenase complex protein LldG
MNSRDTILSSIRQAIGNPSHLPQTPDGIDGLIHKKLASVTPKNKAGYVKQFQSELEKISGEFKPVPSLDAAAREIARTVKETGVQALAIDGGRTAGKIAQKLKNKIKIVDASKIEFPARRDQIEPVKVALVEASYAVADVASLAIPFSDTKSLLPHLLAEIVFVIVRPGQMIANQFELFKKVPKEKLKNMVMITGPSRTADIEKIIILGAHGPQRLIVLFLKETSR